MLLAIDVGNSNIVMGGYEGERLVFLTRLATDASLEADQYAIQLQNIWQLYSIPPASIQSIIISSVVPTITPILARALAHFHKQPPHIFTLADSCGVTVAIDNPAELGTDILASAVAVRHGWPLPAVIIDMGTATKLTALDADSRLLGVAISPGLYVSLDALVQKASALRGVPLQAPVAAIGRNTPESMKSGMILGTAAMLDGMIDRFEREMGGLASVVATGGAASAVAPHCLHRVEVCETLLIDGLRIAAQARAKV